LQRHKNEVGIKNVTLFGSRPPYQI